MASGDRAGREKILKEEVKRLEKEARKKLKWLEAEKVLVESQKLSKNDFFYYVVFPYSEA